MSILYHHFYFMFILGESKTLLHALWYQPVSMVRITPSDDTDSYNLA